MRKFGFWRQIEPIKIERGPMARAVNLVIAVTIMAMTMIQLAWPQETALFAMAYLP